MPNDQTDGMIAMNTYIFFKCIFLVNIKSREHYFSAISKTSVVSLLAIIVCKLNNKGLSLVVEGTCIITNRVSLESLDV